MKVDQKSTTLLIRFMMEMSLAIKSPSIHYHLAGTKKVQQELAKEGVLEKFLGDKAQMESVKDIFTGLYSLDNVRFTLNISVRWKHLLTCPIITFQMLGQESTA